MPVFRACAAAPLLVSGAEALERTQPQERGWWWHNKGGVTNLAIDKELLGAFCEKNHIDRLALFGSVLTERFSEKSDIDVLVQFNPEHVPGYFDLARMERELSAMFCRKVDLRTREELSRYFRDDVAASARLQYEHR
jgi:uncharacterized protein